MESAQILEDKVDLRLKNERPISPGSTADNSCESDEEDNDQSSDSSSSSCVSFLRRFPKILHQESQVFKSLAGNVKPSRTEFYAIRNQFPNGRKVWYNLEKAGNWDKIFSSANNVKTALLLSASMGRVEFVKRLLDNSNADVNSADTIGRSALHLACSFGHAAIVKLLIEHGAIMNRWDSLMEMTPLHCAAYACCVDSIRTLLENGADVDAGIDYRSALHVAVERNATECVELLLKNKANPNTPQPRTDSTTARDQTNSIASQFVSRERHAPALHLAAKHGNLDCVKLLMNSGADVNALCDKSRSALHAAIDQKSVSLDCVRYLLDAGANVNHADYHCYTPLHLAALNESSACAVLLIGKLALDNINYCLGGMRVRLHPFNDFIETLPLPEREADMTAHTGGGRTAFSFIARRIPEVIPKIIEKFDSSIELIDYEIGHADCEIRLDLRQLMPTSAYSRETDLLSTFIEVGQKELLKHPLCETFIFLKWSRIRKFFFLSLLFRAVYVTLFTLFVLGVHGKSCSFPAANGTIGSGVQEQLPIEHCETPNYAVSIGYGIILMNLTWLAKVFFQMWYGSVAYIHHWESWIQWIIICGVFFCVTPWTDLRSVPEWQYHVAAIIGFIVWMELMIAVYRFPFFGLYMLIFKKISTNFAKFLFAYSCLLIAFGLSFAVLFSSYPAFKAMPQILMKAIAMMSGELDFENIFYGDVPVRFPGTSHAIFLAFVVLVTIILTNLLIGLSVSDIQGLQASAETDRLTRQVDLISHLENILWWSTMRKSNAPAVLKSIIQRSALLRSSPRRFRVKVRPNDPHDHRLPKKLKMNIYKLVAERRDTISCNLEPNYMPEIDGKMNVITNQLTEIVKQLEAIRQTQEARAMV